ncbi:MAG: DinB family protein [Acidobacteria bacterium]|nr:DinB family protein [Acidobacteriota bacterium]
MSTITASPSTPAAVLTRLIDEGHTTRAWYGADFLTAIADVDAARAARRPAEGRHNIGEIALHHAYWLHEVANRLGAPAEPFRLEGEDWFEWTGRSPVAWDNVRALVQRELQRLRDTVEAVSAGRMASPLDEAARYEQVLGIAAHAAYHAGQVQLVKRLT